MELEPLPLSIVEHYAYCPRQAALIHVEGMWSANSDTARGEASHAAVDRAVRSESRDGVTTWLSLPVWSAELGIAGVCDAVELTTDGPRPVEHKPKLSARDRSPAAQQLAAQALCLEEMWGCDVPVGILFTRKDARRHPVPIDAALRSMTIRTIRECHDLLASGVLPPILNDNRCDRCSLIESCGARIPTVGSGSPFTPQPEADW